MFDMTRSYKIHAVTIDNLHVHDLEPQWTPGCIHIHVCIASQAVARGLYKALQITWITIYFQCLTSSDLNCSINYKHRVDIQSASR